MEYFLLIFFGICQCTVYNFEDVCLFNNYIKYKIRGLLD